MAINIQIDKLPWKQKIVANNLEFRRKHGRDATWPEYQELHNFKETDYSVKEREWKMLDYANPAYIPAISFGGST